MKAVIDAIQNFEITFTGSFAIALVLIIAVDTFRLLQWAVKR